MATGTMGTPGCSAVIAAPFLKRFGAPSGERSPSGNSTSTRSRRRPNAPACMARTRFASGSTGTTFIS